MTIDPETSHIGILDIGSNSVRFVMYECFGAAFTPVYNEKVLAGLGRDLRKTGKLSVAGKAKALAAITRFKIIAEAHQLGQLTIAATAALRDASDAADFIQDVKNKTGLDIHPISGSEEARLSALGLLAALPRAQGWTADLGGASLELIEINDGQIGQGLSFPLGPFPMIGQDLAGQALDTAHLKNAIHVHFTDHATMPKQADTLYLIGGAWRNLFKIHQIRTQYPLRTLQAYAVEAHEAQRHARWAYDEGSYSVQSWPSISSRRAETLPYSGLLLDVLIEWLAPAKIIISETGLREGLVMDTLPAAIRQRNALLDGCRDLALGNVKAPQNAAPLWAALKPILSSIPGYFDPKNESRLRQAACYLAGMGKGLHNDYQADLVFEDVLYAPLAGLTHSERAYLSLILFRSFTGSRPTPNPQAMEHLLPPEARRAARAFGAAMRLIIVATGRSTALISKFDLQSIDTQLIIQVEQAYSDLITDRVMLRARKLAYFCGDDWDVVIKFIE